MTGFDLDLITSGLARLDLIRFGNGGQAARSLNEVLVTFRKRIYCALAWARIRDGLNDAALCMWFPAGHTSH